MVTGKPGPDYVLNNPATDPKNGCASCSDGYEMLKTQGLGVFSAGLLRVGNA